MVMNTISDKAKQFVAFTIKILVVGLALWFIYKRLSESTWLDWEEFKTTLAGKNLFLASFVLLALAFLNRFFEILKWKNLANLLKPVSVLDSSRQVLSALVFSIFTPNGIGEYGAKALYFQKKQAKNVVFLNFVCNGIQMIITIFFGLVGLLLLGYFDWFFGALGGLLLLWILVFVLKKIKIKGYSINSLIDEIHKIPKKIHRANTLLGISRFVFFSLQQYYLFVFFGVEISFLPMIATIMAVYLIASCLPNFQFFDFMVKGGVAVYFFGLIGVNQWVVMIVALLMWVLNVVLPVLIGTGFVLSHTTKPSIQKTMA